MPDRISLFVQMADEFNWDDLPLDALTEIAGGRRAMQTMRGVNQTWQYGFELSVRSLTIAENGPLPPPGAALALRFSGLTSLDLGRSQVAAAWLQNLPAFPSLRKLVLGRTLSGLYLEPFLSDHIRDADVLNLQGMHITSLSLQFCYQLTDAGLDALRGLPLSSLNLEGCKNLTSVGLGFLSGMPLTDLNLTDCRQLASRAAFDQLRGLPLKWLAVDGSTYASEGNAPKLSDIMI